MIAPNVYVLGGAAVVGLALVSGLLWYRGEAIDAEAQAAQLLTRAEQAERINGENSRAIKDLNREKLATERLLVAADGRRKAAERTMDEYRQRLKKETENDPEVRAWAATPLPAGVIRVLRDDGPVGEDRGGLPVPASSDAVR